MSNLMEEFQKALQSGDYDKVEQLRKDILLEGRDKSIDANFIASIKGKTLSKNLSRMVNGQDFTRFECMKIVSSLITHSIIESELTGIDLEEYPIHDLYILLGNLINDTPESLQDCRKFVTSRYREFLIKE